MTGLLQRLGHVVEAAQMGGEHAVMPAGTQLATSTSGLIVRICKMLNDVLVADGGVKGTCLTPGPVTNTLQRLHIVLNVLGNSLLANVHIFVLHQLVHDILITNQGDPLHALLFPHAMRGATTQPPPDFPGLVSHVAKMATTLGCANVDVQSKKRLRADANSYQPGGGGGGGGGGGKQPPSPPVSNLEIRPCKICSLQSHCAKQCDMFGYCNAKFGTSNLCFRCMTSHTGARGPRCHAAIHPEFKARGRQPGSMVGR
jgi:hypothetical protein